MATLQKIRNKAGVLVAIVIGIALLAFVLSDFINSGTKGGRYRASDMNIAEVNGEKIPYQVFQNIVDNQINAYKSSGNEVDDNMMTSIREQAWEKIITDHILGYTEVRNKEGYLDYILYENTGVAVHKQELENMVIGKDVSPEVKQWFANPQTGQFDPQFVYNFIQMINNGQATPEQEAFWYYAQDYLINTRLQKKYTNLIKKGLYVTNKRAQLEMAERNHMVDFNYVSQPYTAISDSDVVVSDEDLQKYYEEHKKEYEQEASRDIKYVTFDILPSQEDYQAAKTQIEKIKEDFAKTNNDAQFVKLNSFSPYQDKYYKQGELMDPVIDSILFAADSGYIYGPVFQNNTYFLYKISDIKYLPDSVTARHILLKVETQDQVQKQKALADSLIDVLEKGLASFDELVLKYSDDPGSKDKGGVYEWFKQGTMVKPFNDTCFFGKPGKFYLVPTQFGYHIVEILKQSPKNKYIHLAIIDKPVEPSHNTRQIIYEKASQFALNNNTIEKFNKTIEEHPELNPRFAPNLFETTKEIAGLESPRELVRWAYKAKKNDVSEVFEFGNKFVVAVLTEVREKGIAPLEQVKDDIHMRVVVEKKAVKLIEKFTEAINSGDNSLDKLREKFNTNINEAPNINFLSFNVPGAGVEPNLVATAVNSAIGVLSKPVQGNNGVYVIEVTNIQELDDNDLTKDKSRILNDIRSRAEYQIIPAMKKTIKIIDHRAEYF